MQQHHLMLMVIQIIMELIISGAIRTAGAGPALLLHSLAASDGDDALCNYYAAPSLPIFCNIQRTNNLLFLCPRAEY